MNNILFGIIGALMLAVVGIGGVSAYSSFVAEKKPAENTAMTQSQNTQETSAPVVSNTTTRANDDDETDDEEDDDNTGGAATVPAQTSGSGSTGSTGPTSPATTPGTYTMVQVKQHNSAASCYTAINGSVYDVTTWIKQHPGGAQAILSLCGTDGTAAFSAQHSGQSRPANELAGFKIGTLAK